MEAMLKQITLKGFKSIKELENFELGPLTVLIGPNGAGKSNFISFFEMLSKMLQYPGELQLYVAKQGGAGVLLYDGPVTTTDIEANIIISDSDIHDYYFKLTHAAMDIIYFGEEEYKITDNNNLNSKSYDWGMGHREAHLIDYNERRCQLLFDIQIFHFHNTSATARMRNKWSVEDNRQLKKDGANLAPFLYHLKVAEPKYYQRITENIRLILPFFADFEFDIDYGMMLLKWRELDSDVVFSVSQAADGMLRVMALVALLLQPAKNLPRLMILDEPELGLHPSAIDAIGGLIKAASLSTQIIVATQSTTLLDCFEPEDVVVVEREDRQSTFNRLEPAELKDWLDEYSLSELWEKNVLGGRP